MSRTAVIAGQGALAETVVAALDAPLVYALEGFEPGIPAQPFRLERLVPFLDSLVEARVENVVFAGAIRRPRLDPEAFDARTAQLVPRILTAMQSGDDAALREVLDIFEEHDLSVRGVDELLPDLVPAAGVLTGAPSEADRARCRTGCPHPAGHRRIRHRSGGRHCAGAVPCHRDLARHRRHAGICGPPS